MKAWIDIDNPPQVQYLSPFKAAFEAKGYEVAVTARDQGITLDLLQARGIVPVVIGGESEGGKFLKIARLLQRAAGLARRFRGRERPDILVAASRSSDIAARLLRVPNFQFTDYEFSDDNVSRLTRAYLLFPDVIEPEVYIAKGIRPDRLIPFPGLKETISLAGIDLDAVEPYEVPTDGHDDLVRVLFRAPGENAHYYVKESLELAMGLLQALAASERFKVVYAPRYPSQISYLDRFTWINAPHVLHRGVPFVSLLKGVDLVMSSGGTMLREAAYLGVPAYSILRSEIGRVDRYLESLGRLTVIETVADFDRVRPEKATLDPLPGQPDLIGTLVDLVVARAITAKN